MSILYPIKVDVNIKVTDGNGKNGTVTIGCRPQRLPDHEDMNRFLKEALAALPDGFRLMSRHESETFNMRELLGDHCPVMVLSKLEKGDRWHDVNTENTYYFEVDED